MPLLYDAVFQPQVKRRFQLETQRTPIPFPETMGVGTNIQKMDVALPYNKSRVHSANLFVNGTIGADWASPVSPISCEADFYVNGVLKAARGAGPIIVPGQYFPFNIEVNIFPELKAGWNEFQFTLRQSWSILGNVSYVKNLKAYIDLVYTGEPPPPPKPPPPEWEKYVIWGIIGIAGISAAYLGVKLITARRQRRVGATV